MTEESLTFIEKRDKEKYPKENLFVNAAIQYFGRKIEQEKIVGKLEDIQDKLERIERMLEEKAVRKNMVSDKVERKELFGKPDYLK
ncbi:hypothetical protein [Anaerobutyricum hallii]|nr:hypothetical protein [Anaerobutyricum hallii]